jgi:hypothetical protein
MNTFLKFVAVNYVILLWSCGNTLAPKIKNSDVVTVSNGMDKPDTVRYTCDSCEKYIRTPEVLNKLIDQATKKAKESLNNPLSFIPRSIKMSITPEDSLYYYSTNKRIDSCLLINIEYKCIGKNAYGTEGEVISNSMIFLVGDSIRNNFIEEIRKKPLAFADKGKIVDRKLNLYDIDGEGNFSILPTISKPFALIVKTSISCVDKGAKLHIMFDNKSEITLTNWNEFNCNGTAYFNLTSNIIEQLRTKKVRNISFYDDKQIFASVPQNDSEYLMQYVNLISK